MPNEPKKLNIWLIISVGLFLILGYMLISNKSQAELLDAEGNKNPALNAEQAAESLVSFINEIYGASVGEVKTKNVSSQSGLYKIEMELTKDGETVTDTVYTTRDGKMFIPQLIDIEEMKTKAQEAMAAQEQEAPEEIQPTDKPTVQLFTMSYCPYGNQAETGMSPVAKLLGSEVEIEPHYIFYANYQGGGPNYCIDKDSKYCSMHGVTEAEQDIRELCIYKYNKEKYWDYIDKVNTQCNLNNIGDCWDEPAKELGIDTNKISNCLDKEGEKIAAQEVALTAQHRVSGSPTLLINGVKYQNGRSPEAYKTAICNAFNQQPEKCSETLESGAAAASGSCN